MMNFLNGLALASVLFLLFSSKITLGTERTSYLFVKEPYSVIFKRLR